MDDIAASIFLSLQVFQCRRQGKHTSFIIFAYKACSYLASSMEVRFSFSVGDASGVLLPQAFDGWVVFDYPVVCGSTIFKPLHIGIVRDICIYNVYIDDAYASYAVEISADVQRAHVFLVHMHTWHQMTLRLTRTWDINIEISIVMLVLSPFIPTYHKGEALAWSRLASAGRGALYSTTAGLRSPWQFLRRRLQELQKSVSVRRLRPWCALGFFQCKEPP